MFHPVSAYIGLRYLRGRSGDKFSRFVSMMSTMGIAIGVMALITVLSVMNGLEAMQKDRILGALPQAIVSQNKHKTDYSDKNPPAFLTTMPHVQQIAPIVQSEAVIQSSQSLSASMLVGIPNDGRDPIFSQMMMGDLSALTAGSYNVFIGYALATSLHINIGDKVRLMVTDASQYTPLGRIPSQRNFTVAGIFNTGSSDVDSSMVVTNIEDAGRLLRYKPDTITGWRLFVDDPYAVSDMAKLALPDGWHWSDWRAQRGEFFQAVKMEKNMMGLMLGLIVAVAAFNIISALIMVVMEKQAEVAILKTQGMTNHQILAIFIVQGATSGIIGALLGGLLGILLAANLNAIMAQLGISMLGSRAGLPVEIHMWQVIIVMLMAICLSLLATLYPSYRAAAVKPAEALRYE